MKRKIEPAVVCIGACLALAIGCERPQEVVAIHYPSTLPKMVARVQPSEVETAIATLPEPDRNFVQQTLGANMAAIRFGQLAMEKGTSSTVRDLGREMMNSHTLLNDRLRETARNEHDIVLPVARMTPAQELKYARLRVLSGPAFDHAFLQAVLDEQQRTVDTFRREAAEGHDARLRTFADDALPLLHDRVHYVKNEIQIL
jgi:putative membrane protein